MQTSWSWEDKSGAITRHIYCSSSLHAAAGRELVKGRICPYRCPGPENLQGAEGPKGIREGNRNKEKNVGERVEDKEEKERDKWERVRRQASVSPIKGRWSGKKKKPCLIYNCHKVEESIYSILIYSLIKDLNPLVTDMPLNYLYSHYLWLLYDILA